MNFLPHVSWKSCGSCPHPHGIVRLFEEPVAPLVEGLPGQAWVWVCNFELNAGVATIEAASSAPPAGSIRALTDLARSLGCHQLRWERLDHGIIRHVEFPL